MTLPSELPVLDRAEALRRAGGDAKLCRELASVFLRDVPRLTDLISAAIAQHSAKKLCIAAHSLRGSASTIGALAVAGRALILETMCQGSDLCDAVQQQHLLAEDLRQLSLVLISMNPSATPASK
jgi:HPt (histidine-containing phosphotransfer) domain-containing protein